MHEIVADVFTWTWFSEPHGYNFNDGASILHDAHKRLKELVDTIPSE